MMDIRDILHELATWFADGTQIIEVVLTPTGFRRLTQEYPELFRCDDAGDFESLYVGRLRIRPQQIQHERKCSCGHPEAIHQPPRGGRYFNDACESCDCAHFALPPPTQHA